MASSVNSILLIQQYFLRRLSEVADSHGGASTSLSGWSCALVSRTSGLLQGILEVVYVNPIGKKFKNRVEVLIALSILPSTRQIRNVREHHFINSVEFRERYLVTSQLCEYFGRYPNGERSIKSINYENDNVVFSFEEEREDSEFSCNKSLHVCIGNTTILNWGTIVSDSGFHTSNQVFPLGFRCIRQEHDVITNRVVDCICEIDQIQDENNGAIVRMPLFRIIVAWKVSEGDGNQCVEGGSPSKRLSSATGSVVRVYEARSPQQAWQAAMLETVGTDQKTEVSASDFEFLGSDSQESLVGSEDWDAEELDLRMQIREQRRIYFRALRQEQSLGYQAAVRPRLALDSVESFADELISKMIEGMSGILECKSYQCFDSRSKESGKKWVIKFMSRWQSKSRNLEKVLLKQFPSRGPVVPDLSFGTCLSNSLNEINDSTSVNLLTRFSDLEPVKRRHISEETPVGTKIPAPVLVVEKTSIEIHPESSSELFNERKFQSKSGRQVQTASDVERKAQIKLKMRDLERNVRQAKEHFLKNIRRYREEAKLRVELVCDKEEIDKERSTLDFHTTSMSEQINPNRAPRPGPEHGSVLPPMAATIVSHAMEVWEYLHTFAAHLGVEEVPTIGQFIESLRSCDPILRGLNSRIRCFPGEGPAVASGSVSHATAVARLDQMGVFIARILLKDYLKLVGLDSDGTGLEQQRINDVLPVNILTWREIVRVTVLASVAKDIGLSDSDLQTAVRGRGPGQSSEIGDKKAIKLIRKRILHFAENGAERGTRKSCGSRSGLILRIPCPSKFVPMTYEYYHILASLKALPVTKLWLLGDFLSASINMLKFKSELIFSSLKARLCGCLNQFKKISTSSPSTETLVSLRDSVDLILHDFQRLSASDAQMVANLVNELFVPWDDSAANDDMLLPQSTQLVWRRYNRHFAKLSCDTKVPGPPADADADANADADAAVEDVGFEEGDDFAVEGGPKAAICDAEQMTTECDETEQLDQLSVAMQRCFLIIRNLALNTLAQPFLDHVDPAHFPLYCKFIPQPVCLGDIKRAVLSNSYGNSISKFYCDVNYVFENAMAYNPESSYVNQSAQKMLLIFERMFFDGVLDCVRPVLDFDKCIECRSYSHSNHGDGDGGDDVDDLHLLRCDRCDVLCHQKCASEKYTGKGEWFCSNCISQKNVSSIHPLIASSVRVRHPITEGLEGTVLATTQTKQRLHFTIEFPDGNCEIWSAAKVRRFIVVDDATTLDLPNGYDVNDYDCVCGLARGYKGWGMSHSPLPTFISDSHSLPTFYRSQMDPYFNRARAVVASLGPFSWEGGDACDYSSEEWINILRVAAQRAVSTVSIANSIHKFDGENEIATSSCLEKIFCSQLGVEKLIKQSDVLLNSSGHCRHGEEQPVSIPSQSDMETSCDVPIDDESMTSESGTPVKRQRVSPDCVLADDCEVVSSPARSEELVESQPPSVSEAACASVAMVLESDPTESSSEALASKDCLDAAEIEEFRQWEIRRLSRKKGREDALITKSLLQQALLELTNSADNSCECLSDAEFYKALCVAVIKNCINRPSENINLKEWEEAWVLKLQGLSPSDDTIPVSHCESASTSEDPGRDNSTSSHCRYCGFDQYYLASQFVCGQTWGEWEAEGDATAVVVTDKRKKLMDEGGKSKVWIPTNEIDAEREVTECSKCSHRFPRRGSLVVHECCAEYMTIARQIALGRVERAEEQRIVDILVGIGRAKTTPLGSDSNGHLYWVFSGSISLFVCIPTTMGGAVSANELNGDDLFIAGASKYIRLQETHSFDSFEKDVDDSVWIEYDSITDIRNIIDWLCTGDADERQLRKVLQLLYPDATKDASPVVEASRPLSEDAVMRSEPHFFEIGQLVLVDINDVLWEGEITSVETNASCVYEVSFTGWPPHYNCFFRAEQLTLKASGSDKSRMRAWKSFVSREVDDVPILLSSLNAAGVVCSEEFSDAGMLDTRAVHFIDNKSTLSLLKHSLLLLLKAIPSEAFDEHDEKWGLLGLRTSKYNHFGLAWQQCVISSDNASMLMECQLMLEFCIKSSWIKPDHLKILSALPSRAHSMKNATFGMVAVRIWTFDAAIYYSFPESDEENDEENEDIEEMGVVAHETILSMKPLSKKKR